MAVYDRVQRAWLTFAEATAAVIADREIIVISDDHSFIVGDGVTAGGGAHFSPGVIAPLGRLTLSSGLPVMQGDVTAATTVYYTSYIGDRCPIYDGRYWRSVKFVETSLALDSNSGHAGYQVAAGLFDIFGFRNGSGVFTIGTGPAWSSTTARGTGAGTTQISQLNGRWVNTVAITLRFGSNSGDTFAVPINQATYLGTMYATANGQTAMMFAPNAAAGGSANVLGLYNAYNQVLTISRERDSTASWTYGTNTWRAANGNTNNSIIWVDGLGGWSRTECSGRVGGTTVQGQFGTNNNAVSQPSIFADITVPAGTILPGNANNLRFGIPRLMTAYAMENAASGTVTFYGANYQSLTLTTMM